MEDDDLPSDLLRLVAQDEKQILPHQEVTKAINLATEEERREVRIRTTFERRMCTDQAEVKKSQAQNAFKD